MKKLFNVLVVLIVLSVGVTVGFALRNTQFESLLAQSTDFEPIQFVTPASAASQSMGGSGSCGS